MPCLQPWQFGGCLGSDQVAWALDQILRLRATARKRTWVGFLDGESAFCRPHAAFVLSALAACGVAPGDWL